MIDPNTVCNKEPLPNWLWKSQAGIACDVCNESVDVVEIKLRWGSLVNLCCRCLEEVCSYAQP